MFNKKQDEELYDYYLHKSLFDSKSYNEFKDEVISLSEPASEEKALEYAKQFVKEREVAT